MSCNLLRMGALILFDHTRKEGMCHFAVSTVCLERINTSSNDQIASMTSVM
jgi:hypothetical protein